MSKVSAEEVAQAEEDMEYWLVLGRLLGWELFGFTYQWHASFDTGNGGVANINRKQREDIMAAIAKGL